jgi:hypothetical protein
VNTTPVAICTNLPTPGYVPAAGHRFAFTARTGSNTEGVYLDNLLVSTVAGAPLDTGGPVISEFSADNEEMLEDENGDSSDWIEIYNGKATPANLSGWILTDVAASPNGWALPNLSMPAYSYLIVFASSKNRANPAFPLHTNFSLAKTAGYLALVKPGGVLASEFNYGQQAADVSYGLLANGGGYTYGYLETPSPGSGNGGLQAAGPPAEDVVFLKDGLPTAGGLFGGALHREQYPANRDLGQLLRPLRGQRDEHRPRSGLHAGAPAGAGFQPHLRATRSLAHQLSRQRQAVFLESADHRLR